MHKFLLVAAASITYKLTINSCPERTQRRIGKNKIKERVPSFNLLLYSQRNCPKKRNNYLLLILELKYSLRILRVFYTESWCWISWFSWIDRFNPINTIVYNLSHFWHIKLASKKYAALVRKKMDIIFGAGRELKSYKIIKPLF